MNGEGSLRSLLLALCLLVPSLVLAQIPTNGTVKSYQKISDTAGGFTAALDNSDFFGYSVAALGDLDGDGVPDLVVGAHQDDDGGSARGAVYVLFMNTNGTVKSFQKISDTAGSFPATLDNFDLFGTSVAALGDLDGDGASDLAVGAPFDDDGGGERGAVYVLFMNTNGTVKSYQKISDTAGSFTATLDNSDYFGWSVAALGDLDGDGVSDLAVGALGDDDGGSFRGAVYVLFMNTNGTVKSFQKISDTAGSFTATLDNNDLFGTSVAALGDLDGDGVTDLAVAAYYDGDGGSLRGAVYVLFMNTNGTVKSFQKISDTAGSFTAPLNNGDSFGASVSALGDLDGDGVSDLAVGAYKDDDGGGDRGAVYVLFMNANGTVKSYQKISATAGNFTATLDDGDSFGVSVAALGDLDGDGVTDLAVGALYDDDGGAGRGAVYVLSIEGPPAVPTNLTATPGNQQINLTWSANSEADFLRYRIYGGTATAPTTQVDSTTGGIDDTTTTITGLSNGTTYYYRLTAVDSAGNESGYSAEVSETPTAPVTTFTKITTSPVVTDVGTSFGSAWGDYDGDGDLDLFVADALGENNFLYANNGDGSFTAVTSGPVVTGGGNSVGSSWGDFDNDGDLDLFVANGSNQNNFLYTNNGDGSFSPVTTGPVVTSGGSSWGSSWGDFDNDGDLDLFVANAVGENNFLYANNGDGTFTAVTSGPVVTGGGDSRGGSWGDYDNDGDLDLFVANGSNQNNFLYTNNGDGTFIAVSTGPVVTSGGTSWGGSWGDYDNDGDLDLFVAVVVGENNFLYANNGDGTFTAVTSGPVVTSGGSSWGSSWGDYDNDGDLDLFVPDALGENNFLYANNGNVNHWINLQLEGTESNVSAIGAKVRIKATVGGNPVWQLNEISGQTGFGGQNSLKAEFGLGDATVIDSIKIEWPSGIVQVLTAVAVDQFLTITEPTAPAGLVAHYPFNGNANDESGSGNHGTVNGATLVADRFGNANSAYSFDGVDDYIGTGRSLLNNLGAFSLSGWIKPFRGGDQVGFWGQNDAIEFGFLNQTDVHLFIGELGVGLLLSYPFALDEWHFVIGMGDGDSLKLYIDGILQGSQLASSADYGSSGFPFNIGGGGISNPSGNYIEGLLDDIRIYSRALEVAEIDSLFRLGGWVGHVASSTQIVSGTGEVDFPGTDVTMNFTSQTGADTIEVQAFPTGPGGTLPTDATLEAERYWIITHSGSGIFTLDLTLNLGPGTFTTDDQQYPARLLLLQRDSGGTLPWEVESHGASTTDSTVTFTDLTGFSQFTIGRSTDTEGPDITSFGNEENPQVGGPCVIVGASLTDASGIQSVWLNYAIGGSPSFSQTLMGNQSDDSYESCIPRAAITEKGVAYFITAEDSLGNVSRTDTVSIAVAYPSGTLTTSMTGSAFSSGFPYEKWRLISLPGDVSNKTLLGTIQDELGSAPSDATWKIFKYVGPGSDDYQEATRFVLGESYFLKQVSSEQAVHFSLGSGKSYDLTGLFLIMQPRKWHFVSAPYPFSVGVDANQSTFIGPYTYGSFGSGGQEGWSLGQVQTTFEPWGGYIIYNNTDQTQTLDIRSAALSKSIMAKDDTHAASGWLLNLTAEGQDYFDTGNIIGRRADATEGLDDYDHPEPPTVRDGYLSMTVGESDQDRSLLRTSDIRSIQVLDGEWDWAMSTKGESGPIKLTYSLEGKPPPIIALVDLLTQEVYRLSEGEHPADITNFNERFPYRLKVVAGSESYVSWTVQNIMAALPKDFTLSQNYPNPFNPATTIEYALPRPARVSLHIYDLLGQEITTLIDNWQDMGYHETIWYGQDRVGRRVASGVYFAVLRAHGHILTRKMVLLK